MYRSFAGKIALVTGSRGIAQATAFLLAHGGATVVIASRNLENACEAALAVKVETGSTTMPLEVDVADVESVAAMVKKATDQFGGIDVLVNCAGITKDNLTARMTEVQWDEVVDTNLKGAFFCSQAVLRGMRKRPGSSIVNVASVVAAHGNPGQANYAASKGGLIALTKTLAKEYAGPDGVRVNVVLPGYVDTDMTAALRPEQMEAAITHTPMGRSGKPDEIAKAIVFLASSEASYITGAELRIDGGMGM